jgi:DNA-directed RNA polymerase specialized sigma24 family protein
MLTEECPPETWQVICRRAAADAKAGDRHACLEAGRELARLAGLRPQGQRTAGWNSRWPILAAWPAAARYHGAMEAYVYRLSPELRAVLVLKDLESQKYETIAEILQVPIGTVRTRLHRARIELRDLLARGPDTQSN